MRYLVLVTPIPDEPLIVTREQVLAGRAWLDANIRDGAAFPETGGYMILRVPSDDPIEARRQLEDLLDDYPLASTIDVDIRPIVSLDEGFATLLSAVDKRERINTAPRLSAAELTALDDLAAAVERAKGGDRA